MNKPLGTSQAGFIDLCPWLALSALQGSFLNCPHHSQTTPASPSQIIPPITALIPVFLPLDYILLEDRVIFLFLLASSSATLGSPDTPQGLNKHSLHPMSWVCTAGSSLPDWCLIESLQGEVLCLVVHLLCLFFQS